MKAAARGSAAGLLDDAPLVRVMVSLALAALAWRKRMAASHIGAEPAAAMVGANGLGRREGQATVVIEAALERSAAPPRARALARASDAMVTAIDAAPGIFAVSVFALFLLLLTYGAIFGFYDYVADPAIAVLVAAVAFAAIASARRVTSHPAIAVTVALIVLAGISTGLLQHETLLGDYDSGNYAFRAMSLERTGELSPMFLPGYIVYLSAFGHVGGYHVLLWGNAVLLCATLLTMFQLGTTVSGKPWGGLVAAALFGTHYTTFWFARESLSDNLGVFLLFAAVYFAVAGMERRSAPRALFSLVPAMLLLLVRAEGLLFVATLLVALAVWWSRSGDRAAWSTAGVSAVVAIFAFTLASAGAVVSHELKYEGNYYTAYIDKATSLTRGAVPFLDHGQDAAQPQDAPPAEDTPVTFSPGGLPTYRTYVLRFVGESFYKYGLLIPLGLGLLGLATFRRRLRPALVAMFVLSPAVLIIIEPTISWVHPWFMRHYWTTVIPLIMLLAARWVATLESAKLAAAAAALLVGINLFLARPVVPLRDSHGYYNAMSDLSLMIVNRDALVVAEPEMKSTVDPLHFLFGVNKGHPVTFIDIQTPDRMRQLIDENGGRSMYIISRVQPNDAFSGLELADGTHFAPEDLRYIGTVTLDTDKLQFVTGADRYVRPEFIPPLPLTKGYGPVAETIAQLPPGKVDEAHYRFVLYRTLRQPGGH